MRVLVLVNKKMKLSGLSSQQVVELQKKFGKNELATSKMQVLKLLKSNFLNSLSLLLFAVILITYFLDDKISAELIFVLIIINGSLGFYQEYKSQSASEKLKKQVTYRALVKRDDKWIELNIIDLVPGDLVKIERSNRIPADLELLEVNDLQVDESTITGESFPATKKEKSKALMGTFVTNGSGIGVVIAIASKTMIGKASMLLAEVDAPSNFDKNIKDMSSTLVKIILISVAFVFVINVITGKSVIISLLFAVALAVGLVPEALPTIITITLSQGALGMSKQGVIVKRLSAIEDLGNIDILCTDKTGTLTENNVVMQQALNAQGIEDNNVLQLAVQCIKEHNLDQIDAALEKRREHEKITKQKILSTADFDFTRRRVSVLTSNWLMITKGAPESILSACKLTQDEKKKILLEYEKLSSTGIRAIAIATKKVNHNKITKEDEHDLEFKGFVTFLDPPKKSVKETIKNAQEFGVQVKIITGDNPNIALYIANQAGLNCNSSQMLTGEEFDELVKHNTPQAREKILSTLIFARANPVQKHSIIKTLRKYGHVVGYMGDGVNDAPAIKEADVGISVNKGADITKDAADIILLKKSLDSTIQGIIAGRKVFGNVIKYLINTLAGNFGNLFTIGIGSIIIPFVPLSALQILLANFLTDAPMIAVSTDNVEDDELIKPKHWDIRELVTVGVIFGLVSTVFDVIAIAYFLQFSKETFQTALFLEIILTEIIVIFSLRSFKPFYKTEPLGKPLLIAIVFVTLAAIALIYSPYAAYLGLVQLTTLQLAALLAIVISYFIVTEFAKFTYQKLNHHAIIDSKTLKHLQKKIASELH